MMNKSIRLAIAVSVVAMAAITQIALGAQAHAATKTWTGAAGDKKIGTAANWSDNTRPAAGDTLRFTNIPKAPTDETLTYLVNDIPTVPFAGVLVRDNLNVSETSQYLIDQVALQSSGAIRSDSGAATTARASIRYGRVTALTGDIRVVGNLIADQIIAQTGTVRIIGSLDPQTGDSGTPSRYAVVETTSVTAGTSVVVNDYGSLYIKVNRAQPRPESNINTTGNVIIDGGSLTFTNGYYMGYATSNEGTISQRVNVPQNITINNNGSLAASSAGGVLPMCMTVSQITVNSGRILCVKERLLMTPDATINNNTPYDFATQVAAAFTNMPADVDPATSYIVGRYNADANVRNRLGALTSVEKVEGQVHYRDYANGRMYWSPATGVKYVIGAIYAKYSQLGAHTTLGLPQTDEVADPARNGAFSDFQTASGDRSTIYWTPSTGASHIKGAIWAKWNERGRQSGACGYPTTDERTTPDGIGRYNHMSGSNCSIYWTPATGAHSIQGAIKDRWAQSGWETGPCGYPTTDELTTPDGVGRYNHMSGSNCSIYWTPSTGAQSVQGAIKDRWAQLGWETSRLRYPTSNEFAIPGGRQSNFQGGYITWKPAEGARVVYY